MKSFFLSLVILVAALLFSVPQPALAVNGQDCVAAGGACSRDGQAADNLGPSDCTAPAVCYRKAAAGGTGTSTSSQTGTSKTAGSPTTLTDPLGGATFFTLINRVIRVFLGVVGALAFAVFIYAGVLWMTAGSSDRVKQAKDAMKYAVIGLAMIAFSFAITNFLINALVGAGSFEDEPPPPPVQGATELGE